MQLVIFVLVKGHYLNSSGTAIGRDIPAFLHTVCSMTYSPAELASRVATFNFFNTGFKMKIEQWMQMRMKKDTVREGDDDVNDGSVITKTSFPAIGLEESHLSQWGRNLSIGSP